MKSFYVAGDPTDGHIYNLPSGYGFMISPGLGVEPNSLVPPGVFPLNVWIDGKGDPLLVQDERAVHLARKFKTLMVKPAIAKTYGEGWLVTIFEDQNERADPPTKPTRGQLVFRSAAAGGGAVWSAGSGVTQIYFGPAGLVIPIARNYRTLQLYLSGTDQVVSCYVSDGAGTGYYLARQWDMAADGKVFSADVLLNGGNVSSLKFTVPNPAVTLVTADIGVEF